MAETQRYWRSKLCEFTQPLLPTDSDYGDYEVGDTEPCINCCHIQCYATLEEGDLPKRGDRVRVTEVYDTFDPCSLNVGAELTLSRDAVSVYSGEYVVFYHEGPGASWSGPVKVEILERAEPWAERCRCFGLAPANLCPACQAYESERSGRGKSTTPVHPEFARGMRMAVEIAREHFGSIGGDGLTSPAWGEFRIAIHEEMNK